MIRIISRIFRFAKLMKLCSSHHHERYSLAYCMTFQFWIRYRILERLVSNQIICNVVVVESINKLSVMDQMSYNLPRIYVES